MISLLGWAIPLMLNSNLVTLGLWYCFLRLFLCFLQTPEDIKWFHHKAVLTPSTYLDFVCVSLLSHWDKKQLGWMSGERVAESTLNMLPPCTVSAPSTSPLRNIHIHHRSFIMTHQLFYGDPVRSHSSMSENMYISQMNVTFTSRTCRENLSCSFAVDLLNDTLTIKCPEDILGGTVTRSVTGNGQTL